MTQAFHYVARNHHGTRIEGTIAADSVISVADHLRARGLIAVRIARDHQKIVRWLRDGTFGGRESSLQLFYRSLALLLDAGITLRRGLDIVGEQISDQVVREIVSSMSGAVEAGRSLAVAMEMHEHLFSPLVIALIRAAEQSGTLSETLERYAATLERQSSLKRRILGAMLYPAIVLISAMCLLITMLLVILPTLASLFTQMNVEMPLIMCILLQVGAWSANGGWSIVLLIFFSLSGILVMFIRKQGIFALDAFRLRLPVFGIVMRRSIVARWARLLASLLGAGIGIVAAFEATLPALGSPVYVAEMTRVMCKIEDGGTLSEGLRASRWFEALVMHLVSIGEETGRLDANLLRLSDLYERDILEKLAVIVGLIEPLVILVVGIVVGAIVLSVFIPLYTLIGNVR